MSTTWKREHISTRLVLSVYGTQTDRLRRKEGISAVDEVLCDLTHAPVKVVWAAMKREEDRGYIEYGVNLCFGWLTDKGVEKLNEISADE